MIELAVLESTIDEHRLANGVLSFLGLEVLEGPLILFDLACKWSWALQRLESRRGRAGCALALVRPGRLE